MTMRQASSGRSARPKVSVLLAVHDGERYLEAAMESLLAQTMPDFELVAIDDGSTDGTVAILEGFARRDGRLVVARNERNAGLIVSLNRGLAMARGEYVARQDADDVSRPERFELQYAYLDERPEVGLIGSAYTEVDANGNAGRDCRPPPSDTGIRWRMLFHNPFCHSTVMFRRELVVGGELRYDASFPCAEDYELWSRMVEHTRAANIEASLVMLRVHAESVSRRQSEQQRRTSNAISERLIRELVPGLGIEADEVDRLRDFCGSWPARLAGGEAELAEKFLAILEAFERQAGLEPEVVERIGRCWRGRVMAAMESAGHGA